jgi:hypothetical protein
LFAQSALSKVFDVACDILAILSPKQVFADSVASQGSLRRLLAVLERAEENGQANSADADVETNSMRNQRSKERTQRGWLLLESLSSSPSVAKHIIESSAWLELLGILVGYTGFTKVMTARLGAAKTLSRLLWDPQAGPLAGKLIAKNHEMVLETYTYECVLLQRIFCSDFFQRPLSLS